jgi:hypothetical protein
MCMCLRVCTRVYVPIGVCVRACACKGVGEGVGVHMYVRAPVRASACELAVLVCCAVATRGAHLFLALLLFPAPCCFVSP